MSGRIILTVLGKGWGFPGIGPLPTFWPLMVGLGTVTALAGVSLSIMCYSEVYGGSRSTGSGTFLHLEPSRF